MRIVVAPDKFKGSLTAAQAAAHIAAGVRAAVPDAEIVTVPVADGGEGTLDAAVSAGFARVPVTASGPTGEPVHTAYARRHGTAVVELADACGLGRLPGGVPAPMTASSAGAGDVLAAALDAGAQRVVLGVGGSASTDGGAGMLQALGARVTDHAGRPLGPGGAALAHAVGLDLDALHPQLRAAGLILASDVTNPLCGPDGAAAVYGPQKGADETQVATLDTALRRWADLAASTVGADHATASGAGAAGGVGFAALLLGAQLRPGIDVVLDLLGFADTVAGADLVVTGEGTLDASSLAGKAPLGVAAAATRAGVPVIGLAGRVAVGAAQLHAAGIGAAHALTDLEPDVARCLARAAPLLEQLAAEAMRGRGRSELRHAARP